jgi:hypothetical protein
LASDESIPFRRHVPPDLPMKHADRVPLIEVLGTLPGDFGGIPANVSAPDVNRE